MGRSRAVGDRAFLTFGLEEAAAAVTVSTRRAGDLRPIVPGAQQRQAAVLPGRPWSWTRQEHGAVVRRAGPSGLGGDALVGHLPRDRPAMFAADCALIGLAGEGGIVAAVHAGWRGLLAGVIEAAAAAMRSEGAGALYGVRGPCIGPECYEFGQAELDQLVARYGESLAASSAGGRPALDLAAGVREACARAGVELVVELDSCTACARDEAGEPLWFSYRARGEEGRHGLVVSGR